MPNFVVQDGINIPESRQARCNDWSFLETMQPGQSFECKASEADTARTIAARKGIKIKTRRTGSRTFRVWYVGKKEPKTEVK